MFRSPAPLAPIPPRSVTHPYLRLLAVLSSDGTQFITDVVVLNSGGTGFSVVSPVLNSAGTPFACV